MKFGPQILRCKLCGANPLMTVKKTSLGYTETVIWCSHPTVGGQEYRLSGLGTSYGFTVNYVIHDWNWAYGKGYGP